MKETIACHFEFQHTPTWCAEFYIGGTQHFAVCVLKRGEQNGKFERFKLKFFQRARVIVIHYAHRGLLITPTNFVCEFWTPEFVHRLSDALRRPYKHLKRLHFKWYLTAAWKDCGLCDMTQNELAAHVNKVFKADFKPKTVWQAAYNFGLFSNRKNGPKPHKEQTARSF